MSKKRKHKEVPKPPETGQEETVYKPTKDEINRFLRFLADTRDDASDDPLAAGWRHMKTSRGWK